MNAISKSCLSLILLTISATVLCSCGEEIRKEYYENGKIKAETTYKENILHGKAIYYFENGDIKGTGYYKNGEKHGEWLEFCHNGQKKEETHYVDGKEDGVRKRWEKNCSILSSEAHYSKGKKHGPSKMWNNGKPMDEILYSEGEVVSVKVWNDDGSINCTFTTDQELCPNKQDDLQDKEINPKNIPPVIPTGRFDCSILLPNPSLFNTRRMLPDYQE